MRARAFLCAAAAALAACGPGEAARGAAASASAAPSAGGRVEIGAPVPEYRTVSLAGDSVSFGAQRGKVLLVNVWATWCHPCRTEIPELQAIHERYRGRGLELVGVSVDTDGSDDDIRQFVRDFRMTYPIWRDPAERISTQFLVVGVPATFLIDRAGVLRWRHTGPIAPNDTALAGAIDRAIAEGGD